MYINIGTRKLQDVNGAFVLNIPIYAVRTLGLCSGDKMRVVLGDDGILRIEKENIPAVDARVPIKTSTTGAQPTSRRRGADDD